MPSPPRRHRGRSHLHRGAPLRFYELLHRKIDRLTIHGKEAYWGRPEKMYFEQITRDGRTFNRFTKIDR
ncbi:MAG: DUF1653 domain-containing protein [Alloprevotella sp.]|nr:DUF1653 domain-containing protein [Alloprevotella sp.]MDY2779580.1 DUF1653 domain-containing protein [Alloprevotella sp.]MDY4059098.1 DUF1653 domain-containing protein [Alloprevotella sp.]MDY4569123.1 DUF1653 domain-containing protein [Alloprevotella sp.]MDY6112972.1 DUF1653 domain-containing protein [Alloprevotella sp.]